MQELLQKPTDLRNVRLAGYMRKKSSSFPGGWGKRYVVLSANFLYVFKAPSVSPPHGTPQGALHPPAPACRPVLLRSAEANVPRRRPSVRVQRVPRTDGAR